MAKNKKERQLAKEIKTALDKIWCNYYAREGITSGDINPFEVFVYDKHIEELATLIYCVGETNRRKDK